MRGEGVEKVQDLIRNRPADTVRLRVERGHAPLAAAAEEEAWYVDDIDTLTMRSIFNFETENQAIRRAAPDGVTKNGRQQQRFTPPAQEEEKMNAFFQKLGAVLEEENPLPRADDADSDDPVTRDAAVEAFVAAQEYGSPNYASGPVVDSTSMPPRPRTTIDGDFSI